MQWFKQKWLLVLGAIVAVIWLGVGVMLWRAFRAPLGTPLTYPTSTPAPPATATPMRATQPAGATKAPAATKAPTPSQAPALPTEAAQALPSPTAAPARGMCGGPATMDILIIGGRTGIDDNADVIRIIRVDFTKPEVRVVPIPRDLVVELPEDFVERTGMGSPVKFSSISVIGSPAMDPEADRSGGAQLAARVLEKNFGLQVDHYILIDGLSFDNFINDIGGINVYLPYPIEDPDQNAHFPAGSLHLDGHDALLLARIRSDVGELGRIERQHMIVKAIIEKIVTDPNTLARLPSILNRYRKRVVTSLSLQEIAQLMCLFTHLDPDKEIVMYPPPKELLQPDNEAEIYFGSYRTQAFGLHWDERYARWLHDALEGRIPPK